VSGSVPIQGAFVLIGGDPPIKWLEDMGIGYVAKPHNFTRPPTDMLVERLIGRQPSNDKPNLPVSEELSGFFDHAALASLGQRRCREQAAQRRDHHGSQGRVPASPPRKNAGGSRGPKGLAAPSSLVSP
jgi:hypothetical protein